MEHPTTEVCVQPILISAKDGQKGKFPGEVFRCSISLLQNNLAWLASLTQQYSANNIHVCSGRWTERWKHQQAFLYPNATLKEDTLWNWWMFGQAVRQCELKMNKCVLVLLI